MYLNSYILPKNINKPSLLNMMKNMIKKIDEEIEDDI
jgi:hypothetical protein